MSGIIHSQAIWLMSLAVPRSGPRCIMCAPSATGILAQGKSRATVGADLCLDRLPKDRMSNSYGMPFRGEDVVVGLRRVA